MAQGEERSVCISFGALKENRRRVRESWAERSLSLSIDLARSSQRLASILSIASPLERGAPSRVASFGKMWMNWLRPVACEEPEWLISSHFEMLSDKPKELPWERICSTSFSTEASVPPREISSKYPILKSHEREVRRGWIVRQKYYYYYIRRALRKPIKLAQGPP